MPRREVPNRSPRTAGAVPDQIDHYESAGSGRPIIEQMGELQALSIGVGLKFAVDVAKIPGLFSFGGEHHRRIIDRCGVPENIQARRFCVNGLR